MTTEGWGRDAFEGEVGLETIIPEKEPEPGCEECGNKLVVGGMFMQHINNPNRTFHLGCSEAAGKKNPALKSLLKPKSWPPQRFKNDR